METLTADGRGRLLHTLEQLFNLPAANLQVTMSRAADLISVALRAEKLDAFLYDPARDSLIAVGASNQPLSAKERRHGLDVLPLANGGRAVEVFRTGQTFVAGRLDRDEEEIRGVKEVLEIRSVIGVRVAVGDTPRGVMLVSAREADYFTAEDVHFAEIVARWLGYVTHRAELVERIAQSSVEAGRRAVADELVTVLAHDLRNYVSPLDMRLQLLRMRAVEEGRTADLDDLELALRSTARLSGLIANILDVARIDQGLFALDAEPIDLVSLVHDAASVLAPERGRVVVRAAEPIWVSADTMRIRQCLENLIANALRHSPKDAAVVVNVLRQHAHDGERARVDVIDEGPGVPDEARARMFERFVTGQRKQGGLGLGLYLGRRVARAHGGDLTVESAPGRGARFTLVLPCCEPGGTASAHRERVDPSVRRGSGAS